MACLGSRHRAARARTRKDTASVSCLHVPTQELRRNYLKLHAHSASRAGAAAANAALEWDPDKAGGDEIAGQVVWFGCFDGHGGQQVSTFLRDELHNTFENVQSDMVTDTVQYTRELGGYFRRFTGGLLERWVRKEELKPVRAGPAAGRRAPAAAAGAGAGAGAGGDGKSDAPNQVSHVSKPETLKNMLSHEQQRNIAAKAAASSKTMLQPTRKSGAIMIGGSMGGVADAGWDVLTKRIPPPEGMEKETMTMAERLTLAWLVADRQIQSNPNLDVGGSTASVALLHSLDMPSAAWYSSEFVGLHVAHVGDTRMLLCAAKDGKAVPLTTYHHPDEPSESERLRKMGGGMVTDSFGEARWMGALANTRAFGDSRFKKVGITVEPEIFSQVIRGSDYAFVIAFSDGVGGVMSDQEREWGSGTASGAHRALSKKSESAGRVQGWKRASCSSESDGARKWIDSALRLAPIAKNWKKWSNKAKRAPNRGAKARLLAAASFFVQRRPEELPWPWLCVLPRHHAHGQY
ncbi:hypothetical protein L1887_53671 [Cichorium endivia]|nr:hypothetical protein L1887_53671 [Cichorium endivia]